MQGHRTLVAAGSYVEVPVQSYLANFMVFVRQGAVDCTALPDGTPDSAECVTHDGEIVSNWCPRRFVGPFPFPVCEKPCAPCGY